jgi:hypothetical protein
MKTKFLFILFCGTLLSGCVSPGIKVARVQSLGPEPPLNLHLGIRVEGEFDRDPLIKEALTTAGQCAFAQVTFLDKARKTNKSKIYPNYILVIFVESAKVSTSRFKFGEIPSFGGTPGHSNYVYRYNARILYSARIENSGGKTIANLQSREAKGSVRQIVHLPSDEVEIDIISSEYAIVHGGPPDREDEAAGEASKNTAIESMTWARKTIDALTK